MSMPGPWELAFLAMLALLIFGPDKLPGMARSVGQTVTRFKREAQSTIDELKRSADLDDLREVAKDLKSTGDELRKQADLSGPVASPRGAVAAGDVKPPTKAHLPPPFDPHAT
ncbi:MAG: twin-arginine translocase TatA/TatE family subunit [Euzebyales bacterium]|jgi:TatA/E family protein of Tat protein translocase|nr:twin-arginine translocase TatA/TatE family subunit [Euzebyales bacterium]